MTDSDVETRQRLIAELDRTISAHDGILQLEPALVARDWLPPGRRLGLAEDAYDVGERGFICERWLASTTHADNAVGPPDEGISYVRSADGGRLNLEDLVAAAPEAILGSEYARTHGGLGRLAKVYDFGARIPYHIHPPQEQASKVGRRSKDEAYYFPPGTDMGPHPETFFGVHPHMSSAASGEALLEELVRWDSDEILRFARGYVQVPEDGFFIPSGILHAPGTAVTIELQEDSDTLAMFQALNAGTIISKELLFKDVSAEDRAAKGEAAVLEWVDWDLNADPYFYENRHIAPRVFREEDGAVEAWVFYGSTKFSGKRLVLQPGAACTATERGVFNLLVWRGEGTVGGQAVRGGHPGEDELLVVHDRAVRPLEYVNTGTEDLLVVKFFGPDLNPDSPTVPPYRAGR